MDGFVAMASIANGTARGPAARGRLFGCAAGLSPRFRVIAGAAGLVAAMAGCQGSPETSTTTPLPGPHLNVSTVIVNVAGDVNDGWPVQVELVRVATVEAMDALLVLDNEAWFGEAGADFRLRNPDARVDAWEVVPGTSAGPFDVAQRSQLSGVLYCNAGADAPIRFEQSGDAIVLVGDEGCTVSGECEPVSFLSRLLRVPLPAGACSTRVDPVRTRTVTLVADGQVNDGWPVPIDMVRVAYESQLSELLEVTPREWFDTESERFRQNHPGAFYDRWEVVPGTEVGPLDVRVPGRSLAGVLFCGMLAATEPVDLVEGDMVVSIDDAGCVVGATEQSSLFDALRRKVRNFRVDWPW